MSSCVQMRSNKIDARGGWFGGLGDAPIGCSGNPVTTLVGLEYRGDVQALRPGQSTSGAIVRPADSASQGGSIGGSDLSLAALCGIFWGGGAACKRDASAASIAQRWPQTRVASENGVFARTKLWFHFQKTKKLCFFKQALLTIREERLS